jgi:hypothetical protein
MSPVPTRPLRSWNPDAPTINGLHDEQKISSASTQYLEEKSSLDITQKLERKLARLNASESVFKRWIYEIITWAISALCMGGIIAILLYLHNNSLNTWSTGLTIYTVLSKIASAALILPTSEALGQLKWSW